ncbi:MAG: SulP family inorganic anion transporter [Actinomycetes bacterium]
MPISDNEGASLVPSSEVYAGRGGPFASPPATTWLDRNVPLLATLKGYGRDSLKVDAVAGLTVAALAIPSAMGYASIAGLPVQAGLYALLLPVLAYAFLGSSPRLVVGPEGAVAAMIGSALLPLAAAGSAEYISMAAALAILVGIVFFIARLAKIGGITEFMSVPVLVGYLTGIAIFLIVAQLGKLTGIPVEAESTVGKLRDIIAGISELHPLTFAIGCISIVTLLVLKRIPRFPSALIVLVAAIAISAFVDLAGRGVKTTGLIPAGLPMPSIPVDGLAHFTVLLGPAVGIFFVAFSDSILTARSFASRNNENVDTNAELNAFGVAQIAAGLTGGFPIATSGSRTSVNNQTGVRTQVGQIIAAVAVALVLLFLTAPIQYLPSPVLGAIIVVAAASLIVPAEWRALATSSRAELWIAAITAAGVVLIGVIPALLIAMVLSLIDMARRRAKAADAVEGWVSQDKHFASVERHPDAMVALGVVVYRFDASLFYANATHFKDRFMSAVDGAPYPVHTAILDTSCMGTTDATAAEAIEAVARQFESRSIRLLVAELASWPHTQWAELGLVEEIGEEHFYPTVAAAMQAALSVTSASTSASAPTSAMNPQSTSTVEGIEDESI